LKLVAQLHDSAVWIIFANLRLPAGRTVFRRLTSAVMELHRAACARKAVDIYNPAPGEA
jgi:hypothetical protein